MAAEMGAYVLSSVVDLVPHKCLSVKNINQPIDTGYVRLGPILLRSISTHARFDLGQFAFLCVCVVWVCCVRVLCVRVLCGCVVLCVRVLCGCVVLCVRVLCVLSVLGFQTTAREHQTCTFEGPALTFEKKNTI